MVNEQRLYHMIKMAVFDTNDGKECQPMIEYARKDYVSMQMLRSFITGTIAFMLIFLMWGLYHAEQILAEINQMDIKGFLTSAGIKYLIFMLIYFLVTYIVYNAKYTAGRKKVKKYYNNVKQVNKIYMREEKLKSTGSKDWE